MKEIIKACKNLKVPFKILDKNNNIVELGKDSKKHYFVQASSPFNNTATVILSKDKGFTYDLFGKDLDMPKSKAYLDPECNERFRECVEFSSRKEIIKDVEENFYYPVVVKMNRGSRGNNVFLCKNNNDLKHSVDTIFDKESQYYDYMVFVQEYVDIEHEYRAIWFKGKVLLMYEKSAGDKSENLSPLHNESGKATYISDLDLINRAQMHVDKADLGKTFEFLGIDLVIDKEGNMKLLELNARPGFFYFIRDNGDEHLIKMYETIISNIF